LKARKAQNRYEKQKTRQVAFFLLGGVIFLVLLLHYVLRKFLPDLPSNVKNSIPIHVGISIVTYAYHYFFPSNPAPA
jgi:flagellar biogenesis protein FliO